jgi:murein DD-endopeptidase MepM/ murein hydrolase activator NlpD
MPGDDRFMQIIWISGSTSQIKRINITGLGLIKLAVVSCLSFTLIGIGIHFLGFRVALQFKPDLVREMGGVMTLQEKAEIESHYRDRLETLQTALGRVSDQMTNLHLVKDRITELATPAPVKYKLKEDGGKGGPHLPIDFQKKTDGALLKDLDTTIVSGQFLLKSVDQLAEQWERQYRWLSQLPTSAPIHQLTGMSSNYGPRIDPFTKKLSEHPGIDFSAPPGTPILAAGNGVVTHAQTDGAYGQFVQIKHIDGFSTKYAHARKLHVQVGQTVQRGQLIAEVGTTGRSSGPHLHYEVIYNGTLINPTQVLSNRVPLAVSR